MTFAVTQRVFTNILLNELKILQQKQKKMIKFKKKEQKLHSNKEEKRN